MKHHRSLVSLVGGRTLILYTKKVISPTMLGAKVVTVRLAGYWDSETNTIKDAPDSAVLSADTAPARETRT